jgi:hypothetical protein
LDSLRLRMAGSAADLSVPVLHLPSFSFYASGYAEGFAHGALHGTFEGRALGKEKAFELWEEVGYYEGVAGFWKECLEANGDSRCVELLIFLLFP